MISSTTVSRSRKVWQGYSVGLNRSQGYRIFCGTLHQLCKHPVFLYNELGPFQATLGNLQAILGNLLGSFAGNFRQVILDDFSFENREQKDASCKDTFFYSWRTIAPTSYRGARPWKQKKREERGERRERERKVELQPCAKRAAKRPFFWGGGAGRHLPLPDLNLRERERDIYIYIDKRGGEWEYMREMCTICQIGVSTADLAKQRTQFWPGKQPQKGTGGASGNLAGKTAENSRTAVLHASCVSPAVFGCFPGKFPGAHSAPFFGWFPSCFQGPAFGASVAGRGDQEGWCWHYPLALICSEVLLSWRRSAQVWRVHARQKSSQHYSSKWEHWSCERNEEEFLKNLPLIMLNACTHAALTASSEDAQIASDFKSNVLAASNRSDSNHCDFSCGFDTISL